MSSRVISPDVAARVTVRKEREEADVFARVDVLRVATFVATVDRGETVFDAFLETTFATGR